MISLTDMHWHFNVFVLVWLVFGGVVFVFVFWYTNYFPGTTIYVSTTCLHHSKMKSFWIRKNNYFPVDGIFSFTFTRNFTGYENYCHNSDLWDQKRKIFQIRHERKSFYGLPERQAGVAITAIITTKATVLFHSKVLFVNYFLFYFHKTVCHYPRPCKWGNRFHLCSGSSSLGRWSHSTPIGAAQGWGGWHGVGKREGGERKKSFLDTNSTS